MSNRPRLHRRRQRLPASHADLVAAARQAAEADGCRCSPDIVVMHEPDGPVAHVGHDPWCPGLAAGERFAPVRAQS